MGERATATAATALWLVLLLQLHSACGARTLHQVVAPAGSPGDCGREVSQIVCYFDQARTALVGVEYGHRQAPGTYSVCKRGGAPKQTITLKAGVGVTAVAVSTLSTRVVTMQFTLSNGRTAKCEAKALSAASGSRAAAGEAPVLKRYSAPVIRQNKAWLAGMKGDCAAAGYFKGTLEAVKDPCWVAAAIVDPSPVPSPAPRRSPSPSPAVRPSPSPAPSRSPSPTPRPSPSPAPRPSPSPAPQPVSSQTLAVTLYARGQAACSELPAQATADMAAYLNEHLLLLQLSQYQASAAAPACDCSVQKSVPMYACRFAVQGPTTDQLNATEVAGYLAVSVSAGGADFCSAWPAGAAPSYCGGAAGTTSLCAAAQAPADAVLACSVPPPPAAQQMAVTFAIEGVVCPSKVVDLSDAGAAALAAYVGAFVPGYTVDVPAASRKALKCERGNGNAYLRVPGILVSAGSQADVRGAAAFAASALNAAQPGPCAAGAPGPAPAFCADLPAPSVLCGVGSYAASDPVFRCSGAGASFEFVMSNPNDACASNPPPASTGSIFDGWWRQQLDLLRDGKLFTAATVLPGSATQPVGATYCSYAWRVVVKPLSMGTTTAEATADMALGLLSSTVAYRPLPCQSWGQVAEFCKQGVLSAATLCGSIPYMAEYPLQCSPTEEPGTTATAAAAMAAPAEAGR